MSRDEDLTGEDTGGEDQGQGGEGEGEGEVIDLLEYQAQRLTEQQRTAAVAEKFHPSAPGFTSLSGAAQTILGGSEVDGSGRGKAVMEEYQPGRFVLWCDRGGCDIVGVSGGAMCLTCVDDETVGKAADMDMDEADESGEACDDCEL